MMRGEAEQEQRRGDGGGNEPYPCTRASDEDHAGEQEIGEGLRRNAPAWRIPGQMILEAYPLQQKQIGQQALQVETAGERGSAGAMQLRQHHAQQFEAGKGGEHEQMQRVDTAETDQCERATSSGWLSLLP